MINKSDIFEILRDSKLVNNYSVNEIEHLINKFPYFHLSYLIYAKKMRDEKISINSDKLNNISLRIPDRKELFNIINYKTRILTKESSINLNKKEYIEEKKNEYIQKINSHNNPITKSIKVNLEVDDITFIKTVNDKPNSNKLTEILENKLEISNNIKSKDSYQKPEYTKIEEEFNNKQFETNNLSIDSQIDRNTLKEEIQKRRISESIFKSFKSDSTKKGSPIEHEIQLSSKGKTDKQLLKSFLQENPEIQQGNKKTFEKPDPFETFEPQGSFLTESLANIYINQKKYLRAVMIFKDLKLKYPKKKVYFANRIKEIENLM